MAASAYSVFQTKFLSYDCTFLVFSFMFFLLLLIITIMGGVPSETVQNEDFFCLLKQFIQKLK